MGTGIALLDWTFVWGENSIRNKEISIWENDKNHALRIAWFYDIINIQILLGDNRDGCSSSDKRIKRT